MELSYRIKQHPVLSYCVFVIVVVLWLAGCATFTGAGTSVPGHIAYHYSTFNGTQQSTQFQANVRQTIVLHYQATVQSGSLVIQFQDSQGVAGWQITLKKGANEQVSLPDERNDQYTFMIAGQQTSGSFDLSWQVH